MNCLAFCWVLSLLMRRHAHGSLERFIDNLGQGRVRLETMVKWNDRIDANKCCECTRTDTKNKRETALRIILGKHWRLVSAY